MQKRQMNLNNKKKGNFEEEKTEKLCYVENANEY